jgi:hypothetical protein
MPMFKSQLAVHFIHYDNAIDIADNRQYVMVELV